MISRRRGVGGTSAHSQWHPHSVYCQGVGKEAGISHLICTPLSYDYGHSKDSSYKARLKLFLKSFLDFTSLEMQRQIFSKKTTYIKACGGYVRSTCTCTVVY